MRALVLAGLLALGAQAASAQRFGGGFNQACRLSWDDQGYFVSPFFRGNPRYDGRVTFARIKYSGSYECGREGPGWSHDYPRTDVNFVRIMKEISSVKPFVEKGPILGSTLVRLDQPEIFKYP